jgi:TolA-binding protein
MNNLILLTSLFLFLGCQSFNKNSRTTAKPVSAKALAKPSLAKLEDKKFKEELALLKSAQAMSQIDRSASADEKSFDLATQIYKSNSGKEAAHAINQFIQSYPNSHLIDEAYLIRAQLAMEADDFSLALEDLNLVLSQYPKSNSVPLALRHKIMIYQKMNLVDQAQSQIRTLQRLFPQSPEAFQTKGLSAELKMRRIK